SIVDLATSEIRDHVMEFPEADSWILSVGERLYVWESYSEFVSVFADSIQGGDTLARFSGAPRGWHTGLAIRDDRIYAALEPKLSVFDLSGNLLDTARFGTLV